MISEANAVVVCPLVVIGGRGGSGVAIGHFHHFLRKTSHSLDLGEICKMS